MHIEFRHLKTIRAIHRTGGLARAAETMNITLTWMLERLEQSDLALPEGWRSAYPTDADTPSVGTWRGWGKYFLARRKRIVGRDRSESIHPSAVGRSRRAGEFNTPVTS